MNDLISRQDALKAIEDAHHNTVVMSMMDNGKLFGFGAACNIIRNLPSAEPERLTDDDFETIRIHLSAYKERLGNQHRWKEAEEYQRIIDRFMGFASAQSERKTGKWIDFCGSYQCSCCNMTNAYEDNFCPNCGADMRGDSDG